MVLMTTQVGISQDSLDKAMASLRALIIAMEKLGQALSLAFAEIVQRCQQIMLPTAARVTTRDNYPSAKMVADLRLLSANTLVVSAQWKQPSTRHQNTQAMKLSQKLSRYAMSRQETGFRKKMI